MTYKLRREPDSGLILVNIEIDRKYQLKMILDTGTSKILVILNIFWGYSS
jgi:hypothetical protein